MRYARTCRLLGLAAVTILLLAGCNKEQRKWRILLDRSKKEPYGSAIAFETLPHYFPAARVEPLSRWFRYTGINEKMYGGYDSASLLVLLGLDCYVTDDEWSALLKFAKAGNEVFLLSSNLDVHLMRALNLSKTSAGREEMPLNRYNDGSQSVNALRLLPDSSGSFGYRGRPIAASFVLHQKLSEDSTEIRVRGRRGGFEARTLETSIDTTPVVLGTAHGSPDFVRFNVGQGHITLHAAPLVLSNYFLLQNGNKAYLDSVWHSFPANISAVYWNEYYKRSAQSSTFSVLFKYPATRWAIIIAVLTLLLYVLFGLKRRQRIIPVIPPVENASVSFVETVGRLYFNKGNHANLAEKMVQHFLEWVRTHYYLDTNLLNETFVRQLAAKSGKPEAEVSLLVARIHELRLGTAVSPEYLYELHRSIQSFYNAH